MRKLARLAVWAAVVVLIWGIGRIGDSAPEKIEAHEGKIVKMASGSEAIDMESDDGIITYAGAEYIDDYNGKPALRVYCDYTNLWDGENYVPTTFRTEVFQKDEKCKSVVPVHRNIEEQNFIRKISRGEHHRVAFLHVLKDRTSPATIRITDMDEDNILDEISQETTVNIE